MASFFMPKSASSPRLPAASPSTGPSRRPNPANGSSPSFRQPSLSSTMSSNAVHSPANVSQIAYPSPSSQIEPYPGSLSCSRTPHPQVTVSPVRTAHITSLMRTTSLLLPVRYSNAFYSATITDPVVASVSRVALYHDQSADTPLSAAPSGTTSSVTSSDKVIGGIRCRLEPLSPSNATATNLYIQTLHLLSAYRGHGIATSLLESIVYAPSSSTRTSKQSTTRGPSDIVRHYNIRTVTAHVHEANDEALNWYRARGFTIQDGVVEGYYRRLKPSGAKIVRLDIASDEDRSPNNAVPADQDDEDWEKVEAEDCCPTAGEADAERTRKKVKSR